MLVVVPELEEAVDFDVEVAFTDKEVFVDDEVLMDVFVFTVYVEEISEGRQEQALDIFAGWFSHGVAHAGSFTVEGCWARVYE